MGEFNHLLQTTLFNLDSRQLHCVVNALLARCRGPVQWYIDVDPASQDLAWNEVVAGLRSERSIHWHCERMRVESFEIKVVDCWIRPIDNDRWSVYFIFDVGSHPDMDWNLLPRDIQSLLERMRDEYGVHEYTSGMEGSCWRYEDRDLRWLWFDAATPGELTPGDIL